MLYHDGFGPGRIMGSKAGDKRAVLFDHRRATTKSDWKAPGHSAQYLAMLPPQVENMPVGMPIVDEPVKAGVERAVARNVGEIESLDLVLDGADR